MVDYNEDNILERPIPYKILSQIHLSDGGSYHVQMDLKAGIDEEVAEKVIEVMEEQGLLYKVENTDPQLYDVNYSRFEEIWSDLWVEVIADVPTKPVHFGSFLEGYMKSYLKDVKNSSIHEMLVREFLTGLNHEETSNLPKDYEELLNFIEQRYEGSHKAYRHIRHGFKFKE